MATRSVLGIARRCLKLSNAISIRHDILRSFTSPVNSVRTALQRIHRDRCVPNAPTQLQVLSVPPGLPDVGLLWHDNSDNEDGFRVRFRGKRTGFADHDGAMTVEAGGIETHQTRLGGLRSGFEYAIMVAAFNTAGESSPSNEVKVTIPASEETRRGDLQRQPIFASFVPYSATFPAGGVVPKGRLLKIRFPQFGVADRALLFPRRGATTAGCGNSGEVVMLTEGTSTTSDQVTQICGDPEAGFTILDPLSLVACLSTPGTPPNFVSIELTVKFD
jgi:hypothetical protein